jgi:hypothetical protein
MIEGSQAREELTGDIDSLEHLIIGFGRVGFAGFHKADLGLMDKMLEVDFDVGVH